MSWTSLLGAAWTRTCLAGYGDAGVRALFEDRDVVEEEAVMLSVYRVTDWLARGSGICDGTLSITGIRSDGT